MAAPVRYIDIHRSGQRTAGSLLDSEEVSLADFDSFERSPPELVAEVLGFA